MGQDRYAAAGVPHADRTDAEGPGRGGDRFAGGPFAGPLEPPAAAGSSASSEARPDQGAGSASRNSRISPSSAFEVSCTYS
jgi:hypothetical protein